MILPILTIEIRHETDVVLGRQRARQIAAMLGFAQLEQTRVATAVSEIARNAFQYASGGRIEFLIESNTPSTFLIRVRERGPGIENLEGILNGQYSSHTGLGVGIIGAKRLMDRFEIKSSPGEGATVTMGKNLPQQSHSFTPQDLARISRELTQHEPQGLLSELEQQNRELMRALDELRERQAEVAELHSRELDETNRGVVALYKELDEHAQALRRISELKSRFLSNMSHEFRTPLNTILSLSGFLLERSDGDLVPEQVKQVTFIKRAAEGLSALVNDLLDLAKVEAGKAVVRSRSFELTDLFDTLRGTIQPLLTSGKVSLFFEDPRDVSTLRTDEAKLGQILRNFLSNAVKYTERGEIRVTAVPAPGDMVIFEVRDTGIGIARGDLEHIFEEFGQIEGPLQGRIKGTGLGLPLSRKLAELLGGSVSVRSQLGIGSTFFAVIPRIFQEAEESTFPPNTNPQVEPARVPFLVVEDDPVDLLLYARLLEGLGFQAILARTLDEARRLLRRVRPAAVLLDIVMEAENGWTFVSELNAREQTKDIPIFVLTVVDGQERALQFGGDNFCLKPIDPGWFRNRLESPRTRQPVEKILIIDDSEGDRILLGRVLSEFGPLKVNEALNGQEGLRLARKDRPDLILLDLILPDMTGLEVLERLKVETATQDIPVIITTSKHLDNNDRKRLVAGTAEILDKTSEKRESVFRRIRETLISTMPRLM